jgi:beta-barrel assembly-enhancing protease
MCVDRIPAIPSRRAAALVCLFLFASPSCTRVVVAPLHGGDFHPSGDEQDLWNQAAQFDTVLAQSKILYKDDELQQYLQGIADQLATNLGVAPDTIHVHVLEDPFMNAFALPNGSVYVHSGIIARADNEAQIATVLAHEIVHFAHRHALEEYRTEKNRRKVAHTVAIVLAATAAAASRDTNAARLFLRIGDSVASPLVEVQVKGYSRDLEREADALGLQAVIAAGYDPHESIKLYENLRDEGQEANIQEPYFFCSHPRLQERIENCEKALAAWQPPPSDARKRGDRELRVAARRLDLIDAELDEHMGRFAHARHTIDRHLVYFPDSASGYLSLGEWYRHADRSDDGAAEAIAAYRRAIELDPTMTAPYKQLGLLLREHNDDTQAAASFRRYLEITPGAPDAPIIRGYLEESPKKPTLKP